MKIRIFLRGHLALLILAASSLYAADQTTKFYAKPGSKVRIEGTATAIHTQWAVESRLIAGFIEVGPGFPVEPGQQVNPGKLEAHTDPFIIVHSLKSIEADGKPYKDAMDEVMYDHMKAKEDRTAKITYHLTELTLKEPAKAKDAPYICEAKGDLQVAGVTNSITMPVNILPLGDNKLKISGNKTLKMTDFKIQPPAPVGILLKTGDEVKIFFEWMVAAKPATAPTASAK
jgi:hypothetical protein